MSSYAYYGSLGLKTRFLNRLRGVFRLNPLERWLQQRIQGTYANSFWARWMPPEYTYSKGSWRHVERHGLQLLLDLSNATDHGAFFDLADKGDEVLFAHVKPEHVIIDIGANIGIYAGRFAKLALKGKVYAYEPHPVSFARLRALAVENKLSNLIPVQCGISAEPKEHRLYEVLESNTGMNRILPEGVEGSAPFQLITTKPLGAALPEQPTRVDLIKIDVEGFEMQVLEGCRDVIERFKPVLFVELDDENLRSHGHSAMGLVEWIRAMGYEVSIAQEPQAPISEERLNGIQLDLFCLPVDVPVADRSKTLLG